ncbi:hypothetical protein [Neobacillus dielmonensis]|uniref:hypothetical protein n=1 Tax=Neobacillus dielmonensis TaxID=1347369 RepID=UPI0012B59E19|nr:hypothetical protein [Neobacillus dielmonensis]
MFNRTFFQSFLRQIGIQTAYQIWLTAPGMPNFIIIDTSIEGSGELTQQISSLELSQSIQDNKTYLSFNYPGNYQIIVCYFNPLPSILMIFNYSFIYCILVMPTMP